MKYPSPEKTTKKTGKISKKPVDEIKKSAIINTSAIKYPNSCIMHNLQLEGG